MREITQGMKYPYHGKQPTDWAERASLGILYDLNDRRGIKHALAAVDEGVRDDIVKMMASIIRAALPAEQVAQWIPVSERRPEGDEYVLSAHYQGMSVKHARHIRNSWAIGLREGDGCFYTHWMPLPAEPSELPHSKP